MIDPNTSKIRVDVAVIKDTGLKVQRGLLTITSGNSTGNATIPVAIDVDKTFLTFSTYHDLTGASAALKNDIASTTVRGRITTTTNVHFQRGGTVADINIAWEVIEWKQ